MDGPKGETLFHTPYVWVANNPEHIEQFKERWMRLIQNVSLLEETRLLAIVGALFIEDGMSAVLQSVMPAYSPKVREMRFDAKLSVLEALSLIPKQFTNAARCVAKIRNKFAHNFNMRDFPDLPKDYVLQMRAALGNMVDLRHTNISDIDDQEAFLWLVQIASSGFYQYAGHTEQLNSFIRSPLIHELLEGLYRARTDGKNVTHIYLQYGD